MATIKNEKKAVGQFRDLENPITIRKLRLALKDTNKDFTVKGKVTLPTTSGKKKHYKVSTLPHDSTELSMAVPGSKKIAASVQVAEIIYAKNDTEYVDIIRKRVPKKSIDDLVEATEIPVAEMAEIMETTPRKLAAIKPNTLMERSQSEKVVHIARLYAQGEEVFGNRDEFNKWMNGRVPALGKKRPKEYLDTTTGINLLMDELVRIQHGVYS